MTGIEKLLAASKDYVYGRKDARECEAGIVDALAAIAGEEDERQKPWNRDWLLTVGFCVTNDEHVLRKPIKQSFSGDPQWIEADFDHYTTFALCRTCEVYEEKNMPGDRVFFEPTTRGDILDILNVLMLGNDD